MKLRRAPVVSGGTRDRRVEGGAGGIRGIGDLLMLDCLVARCKGRARCAGSACRVRTR